MFRELLIRLSRRMDAEQIPLIRSEAIIVTVAASEVFGLTCLVLIVEVSWNFLTSVRNWIAGLTRD